MNKLLIALAAGTFVVAANPAQAAGRVVAGHNVGIDARIANLETRLLDGVANGRIQRADMQRLRQQIVGLNNMARQSKANGLTVQEQADLRSQINITREDMQRVDRSNRYAQWRDTQRRG